MMKLRYTKRELESWHKSELIDKVLEMQLLIDSYKTYLKTISQYAEAIHKLSASVENKNE